MRLDEQLISACALSPTPTENREIVALSELPAVFWIYTRVQAYRRGELAVGHTLFMLSHVLIFLFSYVVIEDLNAGWLLVNVWHNVQYLAFVWLYNRRRFAGGIAPDSRALSWLTQPGYGRAVLYYLACLALATPAYYLLLKFGDGVDRVLHNTVLPTALLISLSFTLHHYLVDGVIWKRKNNRAGM